VRSIIVLDNHQCLGMALPRVAALIGLASGTETHECENRERSETV
jgi:hypothetical protein